MYIHRLCIGRGIKFYSAVCEQRHDISTSRGCDDICSGALYKELVSSYPQHFVTLTFNTDGIPVFKSSKYAFWPMYLMVNELPYKMRFVW